MQHSAKLADDLRVDDPEYFSLMCIEYLPYENTYHVSRQSSSQEAEFATTPLRRRSFRRVYISNATDSFIVIRAACCYVAGKAKEAPNPTSSYSLAMGFFIRCVPCRHLAISGYCISEQSLDHFRLMIQSWQRGSGYYISSPIWDRTWPSSSPTGHS